MWKSVILILKFVDSVPTAAFDVGDIPKRTSQDKEPNVFGKRLLQLCKETGLYPGFESHSCFCIYLYFKHYSHVAYQRFKCLVSTV